MPVLTVPVERFSLRSAAPFETVMTRIHAAVGHPDLRVFLPALAAAATLADAEQVVNAAVGPTGLMEFVRFDLGVVLRKDRPGPALQLVRILVGNPLIMRRMAEHVADAGAYVPVTILIEERRDGVWLSYDRMATLLAPYGHPGALDVARALDAKIETLLAAAAA
jgi:hypothetical protein